MHLKTLGISFAFLLALNSGLAEAGQTYFEGTIVSIENDGTAWIEVAPQFHSDFSSFTEHMFQDNLHRPYDVFRFHFHGEDLGLDEIYSNDPHAQTSQIAVNKMKIAYKGKKAKILCLDFNPKKSMASCISEVSGIDVTLDNLRKGYAQTHITDATPPAYAKKLLEVENFARDNNSGVWSSTLGLFSKSL